MCPLFNRRQIGESNTNRATLRLPAILRGREAMSDARQQVKTLPPFMTDGLVVGATLQIDTFLFILRMRLRHPIEAMASRRTNPKYRRCELIHRTNLSKRSR